MKQRVIPGHSLPLTQTSIMKSESGLNRPTDFRRTGGKIRRREYTFSLTDSNVSTISLNDEKDNKGQGGDIESPFC